MMLSPFQHQIVNEINKVGAFETPHKLSPMEQNDLQELENYCVVVLNLHTNQYVAGKEFPK